MPYILKIRRDWNLHKILKIRRCWSLPFGAIGVPLYKKYTYKSRGWRRDHVGESHEQEVKSDLPL